MSAEAAPPASPTNTNHAAAKRHLRFHIGSSSLAPAFGGLINATGVVTFDRYPFILLNLAFSLQAAYALHREDLAKTTTHQLDLLVELMNRNTELTELTHQLSQRIESLTAEIHDRVAPPARPV